MPAEIEAKFQADGPGPLASLATAPRLGDASLGSARTVDEIDRYLDTADRRLAARRWACRLREREGTIRVSLKGPADGGTAGWLHRRPEIEGHATGSLDPGAWPESEARDLVDELRGDERLEERLVLRQRRTERAVLLGEGALLGTLSLDVVTVARDGTTAGDLFIVELELARDTDAGASDALARLAGALAGRRGLRADPRTKLEHALERLNES